MANVIQLHFNFVFPADEGGELEFSAGQGEEVLIDDETVLDDPEGMEVTSPAGPEHAQLKKSRRRKAKPHYGFVKFD